jgi:hypothetical protein
MAQEPIQERAPVIIGAMPLFDVKLEERRTAERVELALPGRYMLGDRHEFPCWTVDISPVGIALRGIEKGRIGERIVAYFSQIGRIEGLVARHFDKCFGVKLLAPALKREKLAQQIEWLVQRRDFDAPDHRRHERIAPYQRRTTLKTPDGREYIAALVDVSVPGAALTVEAAPPLGASVTVGGTAARVVRHFAGGIAVEFDEKQAAETFDENVKL